MRFLTSEALSSADQRYLDGLQKPIDALPDFAQRVERAQQLWRSRTQNSTFRRIRQTLLRMCVGVEICHYCENNEATDIEHILPKSFFPEETFVWENYLLACKICNSHYKLDRVAVFWPEDPCTRYDIPRGFQPPSTKSLMIHPRREDPQQFWGLNLRTGILLETADPDTCAGQRASYTLEILSLNDRDALREAREKAARERFRDLSYAVRIHEAPSFVALDAVVNAHEPFIALNSSLPLSTVQRQLLDSIRDAIRSKPHPSVWDEIKLQHRHFPRFLDLFNRLPEALTW
jgi:uncharacterized protein (TIGR02646 family)